MNVRSHTGGTMAFDVGVFSSMSKMQKLNIKSSADSEIVGVNYYLPNVIRMRLLMEAQGYHFEENIVYQDN